MPCRIRARLLLALRDGPGYPAELADLLGTTRQNLSYRFCVAAAWPPPCPRAGVPRYELTDPRLAHALGDLLGLVLTVDPAACPDAADKDCC